jgi:hypothetical protein
MDNREPFYKPILRAKRAIGVRRFDATRPANLTHTKVVSAKFGGATLQPANWNRLLDAAVSYAATNNAEFSKLRRLVAVKLVRGQKERYGYHCLSGNHAP